MTTTATSKMDQTFNLTVLYTEDTLTVTVSNGKTCKLDLNVVDNLMLASTDATLMNRILSSGSMDEEHIQTLTMAECHALARIRGMVDVATARKSIRPSPVQPVVSRPPQSPPLPTQPVPVHVAPAIVSSSAPSIITMEDNHSLPMVAGKAESVERQTLAHHASRSLPLFSGESRSDEQKVDRAMARIQGMEKLAGKLNEPHYVFTYDIDDDKKAKNPNPSHAMWMHDESKVDRRGRPQKWRFPGMWAFGFRYQLSCWIVPQSSLDSPKMQRIREHWERNGIESRAIRQHDSELANIREFAAVALRKELITLHTSLIEGIASADAIMAEKIAELGKEGKPLATEANVTGLRAVRDNKVRARLKKSAEQLQAAIACAEAYDAMERTHDLRDGLKHAIRAAAEAFDADMRSKRSKASGVNV